MPAAIWVLWLHVMFVTFAWLLTGLTCRHHWRLVCQFLRLGHYSWDRVLWMLQQILKTLRCVFFFIEVPTHFGASVKITFWMGYWCISADLKQCACVTSSSGGMLWSGMRRLGPYGWRKSSCISWLTSLFGQMSQVRMIAWFTTTMAALHWDSMLGCRDPHPIAEILSDPRLIPYCSSDPILTILWDSNTTLTKPPNSEHPPSPLTHYFHSPRTLNDHREPWSHSCLHFVFIIPF